MKHLLLFAILLGALSAEAAICLRFPGAPAAVTASDGCEDALADFERAGRVTLLMRDYDDFLFAQERNPKKAWRDFLQKALKKVWSAEDERLIREVMAWARTQGWKLDPQLRGQMELLAEGSETELRPRAGGTSWLESLTRIPGMEDVRVVAPTLPGESESAIIASSLPRRWIVYSSAFRPRAYWARATDLPALVRTGGTSWVAGDCLHPEFSGIEAARFEVRAYGASGCSTANLAKIATGLPGPAPTNAPLGANTAPQLKPASKTNWMILGLLAGAAAAAYSLRDKNIVITHGFNR
ncbi:MAG: hypothetical protein KF767_02300 [Bdellovibrionaceae bacterium]|nr:hypothetical protein [Pseudobdellovibrionaceae bacterium]